MATQVNNMDHWTLGLCFVPVVMALTYYYPMLGAIVVLVLTCFAFAKKGGLVAWASVPNCSTKKIRMAHSWLSCIFPRT